jgi:hypothetical protein
MSLRRRLRMLPVEMVWAIVFNGIGAGIWLLGCVLLLGKASALWYLVPAGYLATAWLLLNGYRLGIYLTTVTLLVFGAIDILVNERVIKYIEFCRMLRKEKR